MRDNFGRRSKSADYDVGPDAENYLAKVIYAPDNLGPVGFVHFDTLKKKQAKPKRRAKKA